MRARHAVPLLAVAVLTAFVACSDYAEDAAPRVIDAGPEASTIADAAPAPPELEAAPPAEASVEAGPSCETIHVAPDGNDAATGCGPATAKKTIGAALMVARATPSVRDIRACAGVYHETRVTLDVPVSLLGGFGCSSFKQIDGYGHPTYADAAATVLESDDAETLVVTGAAIGPTVRIDGLTVLSTGQNASTAVLVREKAAPAFSNVRMIGHVPPSGSFAKAPSVALLIATGASPDIGKCAIDGGAGRTPTVNGNGSIGVQIESDAGAPHLHDSIISGGSGQSRFGSMAILLKPGLSLAGASAIERNVIFGGTGTGSDTGSVKYATIAINAAGLKALDLLDNIVDGGKGTCLADFCLNGALALNAEPSAVVHVERNRIFAGELTGPPGLQRFAVSAAGGTGTFVDNLVHLGKPSTSVTAELGISLQAGNDRVVAHNTIAGFAATGSTVAEAFIELAPNEKGARVLDNLYLGSTAASSFGLVVRTCEGATIKELRGNLFAGFDAAAFVVKSDCAGPQEPFSGIASLEARQNLLTANSASANHRLAADCTGDTPQQCQIDPTCAAPYPGCVPALVTFDAASGGAADLATDAWRPKATSPLCAASAVAGAPDTSKISMKDVSGTVRTLPPTIGAHQGCQ